jgi:glycosyltransferase involved in cell wall biosynthesis
MKVGIDARFYGPSGKGIGRYTQKLIESLEKLDSNNEYFIFLNQEGFDSYQPANSRFHKILVNIPWYSVKEQLLLPKILKQYQLDLMHFLHFNVPLLYQGRFVVTVHDLIHLKFNPRGSTHSFLRYLIKYWLYRMVSSSTVKRSSRIITVSEFVKKQIIDYYKVEPKKINVTYEATFMSLNDQSLKIKNLPSAIKTPYLLYVGNAYPHKNLEKLLEAFKVVSITDNIYLVLVGKKDYFYQVLEKTVKNLGLENKIIFFGQASDDDLSMLYQNALAYIFPSLMEGFGLPGLEAMAHDCPVLSSNAGSLPEIYGPAALYFNPESAAEMAETIRTIAHSPEQQEKLKKLGQEQIKKYSWDKCAQQTLDVYNNL